MQAALDGHGVALGFTGLATDLLAKGQLVKPLDTELTRGLAVYLVTPRSSKPPPPVRSFIRWMTAEAGLISNGVTTNPIVTD
jgi:LysR family glycine cleavage system transcriptional activator